MKKMIWILMLALALTACTKKDTTSEPTLHVAVSSSAEMDAPKIHVDGEEFVPPDGQQKAIDAYQEIIDFFVTPCSPEDPDYPGYPDDFADAYIGEDHYLYVCLTDIDGPEKTKYLRAVTEPRILRFVQVEHSYRDLMALQTALAEIEGLDFSYIGVDVTGNEVDMGIPDIGKEEEVWALVEQQLPEEVKERFDQLPLTIEEEPYASFA